MDALEMLYGKETFTLYGLFAKVPGKKLWPRVIFVTLSITLLSLGTIFQLIKLVLEKFALECVIDLVPTTAATLGTLVYVPFVAFTTEKQYNGLLTVMLKDLKEERTVEEDAIKREYAEGARLFIKMYTIVLIVSISGLPVSGLIPLYLDWLIPLNQSREVQLLANGEIFIDQKKYFYHIYFLESCIVLIVCIVIGISENMSVIIGQHACGMAAVLAHRLENITNIEEHRFKEREAFDKFDYVDLITKRLHKCIEDHQKLLRFALLGAAFYDVPLTLILAGSFCALTVSLVQVTDPQLMSIKMVIYTTGQFFQLFLVSRMGQSEIDATLKISEYAYYARWDICPGNVRRIFQLIILRSSKPCLVMARGIYVLSIENFMSVIQTITSFYMVLRQAH